METAQFTKNSLYLMLALDHRESFRKLINQENPESVTTEEAQKMKEDIIESTYNFFSGILVDYDFGLGAYRSREENTKPFLLPVEKSGYTERNGGRITEIEFSGQEIKNLGANGIKLLVYINPNHETIVSQIETSRKVIEDAHRNGLPVFLEIVTYDNESPTVVFDSVKMFVQSGVIPDVFKLEFPGSKEECQKITELLKEIPWIILTRGADFETFTNQLKIAIENGCRGFLAGRGVWQELPKIRDPEQKEKFLKEILPIRFEGICKIAEGKL